jgi:hypothetical protein
VTPYISHTQSIILEKGNLCEARYTLQVKIQDFLCGTEGRGSWLSDLSGKGKPLKLEVEIWCRKVDEAREVGLVGFGP